MVITSIFYVLIKIWDTENDGTKNYLLETPRGNERQYHISYSSPDLLPFKEGEVFKIKSTVECFEAFALDKAPKTHEDTFPFGIPRKQWLCTATKLEVVND